MAVSPSPIVSPLQLHLKTTSTSNSSSPNSQFLFHFSPKADYHKKKQPRFLVFSQKSTVTQKRELLQSYGLNPDEFLSDPSPKSRRRKEKAMQEPGKRKRVQPVEPPPERTTHKLLQVLGGTARRKKLLSPKSMDVRPMMEVVKGAAFSILQAAGGCPASLRPGRWLDLYSGTGSVGIEAISRGCSQVHFVEMDPWVVSDVLWPNLEWTGFLEASVIHTVRVEDFLERAEQFVMSYVFAVTNPLTFIEAAKNQNPVDNLGRDGPFDYISVTPPYTQVDYEVLMDQLSKSALIGEDSFIVVEYPLRTDMLDSCGCLVKITDRRFGRTNLAIYGPKWAQRKRKSD